MALFLKTAELIPNAAWFPWQSFLYIIFISPRFSRREKIQREEKNLNPFRALKNPKALLHWRTAGNRNVVSEVITLQGAVISWHEEEWRGLKWVLMYKDINSYPKFWVPTHYIELAQHPLHQRVSSAALKRKCPTKILAPWGKWWLHQHLLSGITAQELSWMEHNEGRNFIHLSFDPAAFNTLQGDKVLFALASDVVTATLVLHNK